MHNEDIPMIPDRLSAMPLVYGNTPSFLGCPISSVENMEKGFDVAFAGVPWEGTITWGSFSGCELAPRQTRHAAARYGGFLPEYDIDLFDYLKLCDLGDISINPNKPEDTMHNVYQLADAIYASKAVPFILGGDHSFTPEIVRALADHADGEIGLIHFDAHFDNSESFGNDRYPRCGPIFRIAQIDNVNTEAIVHIGIRGPRNSRTQLKFAREIGATVFTSNDILELGIEKVITEAIQICRRNAKYIYVTICSDILDASCNPGGPPDFDGLSPRELFKALHQLGQAGIAGLDYVEVYPSQDPKGFSAHLSAWAMIHALVGMAIKKSNGADVY